METNFVIGIPKFDSLNKLNWKICCQNKIEQKFGIWTRVEEKKSREGFRKLKRISYRESILENTGDGPLYKGKK